jgi:hypothetical protein
MSLIRCKDGRLAPAIIICRHLFDGSSSIWVEAPTPGREMPDYFCPDCLARFIKLGASEAFPDDDDLFPACMHCAGELRRQRSGRVFTLGDRCLVEKMGEGESEAA